MKKVIFGGFMLLSGMLGAAILMSGAMAQDWYINEAHSFSWNLHVYGLMPVLYVFICIGVVGLIIACWGLFDKPLSKS